MIPEVMLRPVLIAGILLAVMSIVDTLSYGVRTAGVYKKRLAISLSLFNILVIVSRLSNMFMAPVLGNFPDKVYQQAYDAADVLVALRIDLGFVIGGVLLGALLTPWFINITGRGIEVLEEKGNLPATIWHGLKRIWRVPAYARVPSAKSLGEHMNFRAIPSGFLIFNVLVTCFYSIGVMSTILAASWDHSLAVTTAMLSGIVNGIATMLLFTIVDPPAAVLIDGCIAGKRPDSHAKTMNAMLVLTRLAGCVLAVFLLPLMAQYVMTVSRWVDDYFRTDKPLAVAVVTAGEDEVQMADGVLGNTTVIEGRVAREFSVERKGDSLHFRLAVKNGGNDNVVFNYSSGAHYDFHAAVDGQEVWSRNSSLRFTQALEQRELEPGEVLEFRAECPAE